MRHFRLIDRLAPAVALLVGAAACADELNNPQVESCDETLEIQVAEAPATINYLVAADGNAIVNSVTYTTPSGDQTVTSFTGSCGEADIVFCENVPFDEPVDAILRARGEVATGGQIGITYSITFEDATPITGPIAVCGG